jgi:hypothetical protein
MTQINVEKMWLAAELHPDGAPSPGWKVVNRRWQKEWTFLDGTAVLAYVEHGFFTDVWVHPEATLSVRLGPPHVLAARTRDHLPAPCVYNAMVKADEWVSKHKRYTQAAT